MFQQFRHSSTGTKKNLTTLEEARRAFIQALLKLPAPPQGYSHLQTLYILSKFMPGVHTGGIFLNKYPILNKDGDFASYATEGKKVSHKEATEIIQTYSRNKDVFSFMKIYREEIETLLIEGGERARLLPTRAHQGTPTETIKIQLPRQPNAPGLIARNNASFLDDVNKAVQTVIANTNQAATATNAASDPKPQPSHTEQNVAAPSWKAKWASKREAARAQAQKLSQKIDTLENKNATTQKMGKALRFTFNAAVSAGITLGAKALTCTVAAASCSAIPTIAAVAAIAATGAIVGVLGAAAKDFAKERFVEKNMDAKFWTRDRFMAKKNLLRAASGMTGALVGIDALNGFETLKSAFDTVKGWMPSFGLKAPAGVIQTAAKAASATAQAASTAANAASAVARTVAQSAPAKALADATAKAATAAELNRLNELAKSAKESAARITRRAAWAAKENATSAKLGEKWTALRAAWLKQEPEGQEWIRTTVTPNPPPVQTPVPTELTGTKGLPKPVAAAPLTPDLNPVAQAVTQIESCEEIGNGITQCDTLTLSDGHTITAKEGTDGTPGESVTLPGGDTLMAQHLPPELPGGTQTLASAAGSTPAP